MPDLPLRPILLATTLGMAAKVSRPNAAPPPKPAAPLMGFDGHWSVVIVTDAGSCDRAYRYGLRISGGRISYDGDSDAVINGQVDTHNNVLVNLRDGHSTANGLGLLTEPDGEGGGRAHRRARAARAAGRPSAVEHDPEKWIPVFGKDHAHTN